MSIRGGLSGFPSGSRFGGARTSLCKSRAVGRRWGFREGPPTGPLGLEPEGGFSRPRGRRRRDRTLVPREPEDALGRTGGHEAWSPGSCRFLPLLRPDLKPRKGLASFRPSPIFRSRASPTGSSPAGYWPFIPQGRSSAPRTRTLRAPLAPTRAGRAGSSWGASSSASRPLRPGPRRRKPSRPGPVWPPRPRGVVAAPSPPPSRTPEPSKANWALLYSRGPGTLGPPNRRSPESLGDVSVGGRGSRRPLACAVGCGCAC